MLPPVTLALCHLAFVPSARALRNIFWLVENKRTGIDFRALRWGVLMQELPIIQKTYDLIKWYVPILNRLPRDHKFTLGDRMIGGLYQLLEGLIQARYARRNRLARLEALNTHLDILRYQTRLLLEFELISTRRYDFAGQQIIDIGSDLGGWIKKQRGAG